MPSYRYQRKGGKLRASEINRWNKIVSNWDRGAFGRGASRNIHGRTQSTYNPYSSVFICRNTTGDTLQRFQSVSVDPEYLPGPEPKPDGSIDVVPNLIDPNPQLPTAVLVEPILDGQFGLACLGGVAIAELEDGYEKSVSLFAHPDPTSKKLRRGWGKNRVLTGNPTVSAHLVPVLVNSADDNIGLDYFEFDSVIDRNGNQQMENLRSLGFVKADQFNQFGSFRTSMEIVPSNIPGRPVDASGFKLVEYGNYVVLGHFRPVIGLDSSPTYGIGYWLNSDFMNLNWVNDPFSQAHYHFHFLRINEQTHTLPYYYTPACSMTANQITSFTGKGPPISQDGIAATGEVGIVRLEDASLFWSVPSPAP